MGKRLWMSAVLATALGFVEACSCGVPATNPYDPDTPPEEQAPAMLVGRVVLPARNLATDPVQLQLLDGTGQVAQSFDTLVDPDYVPAGVTRDDEEGLDGVGTFELELPPGMYGVRFNASNNSLPLYRDVIFTGLELLPGETEIVPTIVPGRIPEDLQPDFPGALRVEVSGTEDGEPLELFLRSTTDDSYEQRQVVTDDGEVLFESVPEGEYQVYGAGESYVPAASDPLPVQQEHNSANPANAGTLSVSVLGNFFAAEPTTGADLPYVPAATGRVSIAPVVVLANAVFDVRLYVAEAGAPADDTGWESAPTSAVIDDVDLDDTLGDGPRTVVAQLRMTIDDDIVVKSRKTELSFIVDTTSPAPVSVSLDGSAADATRDDDGALPGAVLQLGCARFDATMCPPEDTAAGSVTLAGTAIVDEGPGRLRGWAMTVDDDAAPTTFDALSAAPGMAVISVTTPELERATEGTRTLRLWAEDAAGNVGLLHVRDVVVDVTPVAVADPALTVMTGASLADIDGSMQMMMPGETLEVDLALGGMEQPALWRVTRADGASAGAGSGAGSLGAYEGPVTLFVDGVHRDDVLLSVEVYDQAGNPSSIAPFQMVLWRAGDVSATVALEGGDDPSIVSAALVDPAGDETATTVTSTGSAVWPEQGVGLYTLRLTAAGYDDVLLPGVSVLSGVLTNLGTISLLYPRGDLTGRVVLAGREDSLTDNAGIQVTAYDDNNLPLISTATLPDGSYRLDGVRAGTGYTVRAAFVGYTVEETFGVQVVGGGETPVALMTLQELTADFSLCATSAQLDPACLPLQYTNLDTVQAGVDPGPNLEYRISLIDFVDDTTGWTTFASGPPRVTFPAEGSHTVYLQLRVDAGTVGDVLEASITFDQTPPASVALVLQRGADALLDGYTNEDIVTARVTASDALSGLKGAHVVFDPTPPAPVTGTDVPNCAHGVDCPVSIGATPTEGPQTAWAMSCDRAGNCSAVDSGADPQVDDEGAVIVYDVTEPDVSATTGAAFTPDVSVLQDDGTRVHVPSRTHDVTIGVGTATATGPDGQAAQELVGTRVSLDPLLTGAALVDLQSAGPAGAQTLTTPSYNGAAGEYEVFLSFFDAAGNETPFAVQSPHSYLAKYDPLAPRVQVSVPSLTNDCEGTVTVDVTDLDNEEIATLDVSTPEGETGAYAGVPAVNPTVTFDVAPAGIDCVATPNADFSSTAFPDGDYVVTATAGDRASNLAEVSRTVRVDRTAPALVSVTCSDCSAADDGTLYTTTTTPTVVINGTDALSGYAGASYHPVGGSESAVVGAGLAFPVTLAGSGAAEDVDFFGYDHAGNRSSGVRLSIVVDTTAPTATLVLAAGADYTTTRQVGWEVSGADADAVGYAVGEGLSCAAADYGTATSGVITLSDADALKTVTLCLVDVAGNPGQATDGITLDRAGPVGALVIGGADPLSGLDVSLALSADEDFEYAVANGSLDCSGASYGGSFADTANVASHTLIDDEGERTVVGCLRDAAGNVSQVSDTVVVDRVAPAGSASLDGGAAWTQDDRVTVSVGYDADTTSMYLVADDADTLDCDAVAAGSFAAPSATVANHDLDPTDGEADGTHGVAVCLRDDADNRTKLRATIGLDRSDPTGATLTLAGGADYTNVLTVGYVLGSVPSDVDEIAIGEATLVCASASYVNVSDGSVTLSGSDGSKTVEVCLRDAAGRTAKASDTITLDRAGPSDVSFDLAGGARFLNSATAALALDGTDTATPIAYDLTLVNLDGSGTAISYSGTLPGPANVSLSDGDGTYQASGTLTDAAGNSTSLPTIELELDTARPCATAATLTLDGTVDGADLLTTSPVVAGVITCSGEEPTLMQVACDGTLDTELEEPFSSTVTCALNDGSHDVLVRLLDASGNPTDDGDTGASLLDSIIVDRTAPSIPRFAEEGGLTNNPSITLSALAVPSDDGAGSGLATTNPYELVVLRPSGPTSTAWDGASSVPLPLEEGENRIRVRAYDRAGNVSDDDQIEVTLDTTPPVTPEITRLVVAGGDAVLEFDPQITGNNEQQQISAYKVYYGLSDTSIAGLANGGSFLTNGPSPLNIGLAHGVRLLDAPLGQPLFVRVSAVDLAGNESDRSLIATVDIDPDGFEVLSSFSAQRLGVLHGHGRWGLAPVGNGFEIIDLSNNSVVMAHGFDPGQVGIGFPHAGALFVAPPPGGGPDDWLYAAVAVPGRGLQARWGDVLIYALDRESAFLAGTQANRGKLVDSFAALSSVVDLQATSVTPGGQNARLVWLEWEFAGTDGWYAVAHGVELDGVNAVSETSLGNGYVGCLGDTAGPGTCGTEGLGIALLSSGGQAVVSWSQWDGGTGGFDLVHEGLSVPDMTPSGSPIVDMDDEPCGIRVGQGVPAEDTPRAWFSVSRRAGQLCNGLLSNLERRCARRVTLDTSEVPTMTGIAPDAGDTTTCQEDDDDRDGVEAYAIHELSGNVGIGRRTQYFTAREQAFTRSATNELSIADTSGARVPDPTVFKATPMFADPDNIQRSPLLRAPMTPWDVQRLPDDTFIAAFPLLVDVGPLTIQPVDPAAGGGAFGGESVMPSIGSSYDLVELDGYAVVAYGPADTDLRVYDLASPSRPKLIASMTFDTFITERLARFGHIVYAAGPEGIKVIDLADPARPSVVTTYSGADFLVKELAVGGSYPGSSGPQMLMIIRDPSTLPQLIRRPIAVSPAADFGKLGPELARARLVTGSVATESGLYVSGPSLVVHWTGMVQHICPDFGNGDLSAGAGRPVCGASAVDAMLRCWPYETGQPSNCASGQVNQYASAVAVDGADLHILGVDTFSPSPNGRARVQTWALTKEHRHAFVGVDRFNDPGDVGVPNDVRPFEEVLVGELAGIQPPEHLLPTAGAMLLSPISTTNDPLVPPFTYALETAEFEPNPLTLARGRFGFQKVVETDGAFVGIDGIYGAVTFAGPQSADISREADVELVTPDDLDENGNGGVDPYEFARFDARQRADFVTMERAGAFVVSFGRGNTGQVQLLEFDGRGYVKQRGLYPDEGSTAPSDPTIFDVAYAAPYVLVLEQDGVRRIHVLHTGRVGYDADDAAPGAGIPLFNQTVMQWGYSGDDGGGLVNNFRISDMNMIDIDVDGDMVLISGSVSGVDSTAVIPLARVVSGPDTSYAALPANAKASEIPAQVELSRVLTWADGSGAVTLRRPSAPGAIFSTNVSSQVEAELSSPMLTHGRLTVVTEGGQVRLGTRLTGDPADGSPAPDFVFRPNDYFEYQTPLGGMALSGDRLLVSVRVNLNAVSGAFPRLALVTPAWRTGDLNQDGSDEANALVGDPSETAAYAGGVENGNVEAGAVVQTPWGALWADRGVALRLMSTSR
jgi:hypothetical protein